MVLVSFQIICNASNCIIKSILASELCKISELHSQGADLSKNDTITRGVRAGREVTAFRQLGKLPARMGTYGCQ